MSTRFRRYLRTELLNSCITPLSAAQPLNPADRCRAQPSLSDDDVSISRSFVFSPAACEGGERREKKKKRLSAKQQEGRAMATLDRQIPSVDTFICEPWSSFVSAAKLGFVDSKFARR